MKNQILGALALLLIAVLSIGKPADAQVYTFAGMAPGTPISASSGNVANASAIATLAGATAKTTYISGFRCDASGATAGLAVSLTVVGLLGGTQTYEFTFPSGVAVGATPVFQTFNPPYPASSTATAIVVTLPAGGAGNTNATCNAQGFQF
jgi:hypothetical protein